jgi:hypothetical protein
MDKRRRDNLEALTTHADLGVVADTVTAVSTLGLLVIAVVAASVAYGQFQAFKEDGRVRATLDVLEKWGKPKVRWLLGQVDLVVDPCENRRRALRIYEFAFDKPIPSPTGRKTRLKRQRLRDRLHDGIQEIDDLASRTWSLLKAKVVDSDILFDHLDYDILSTYFILEDVLAKRQVEDQYLYSGFTSLANAAQLHYKKRPDRERVDELVDAFFEQLPLEEDEYGVYLSSTSIYRKEKGPSI